jgi:electron transport complex protein RnfG
MKVGVNLQSIIVLTAICAVWAGVLAVAYGATKLGIERIENEKRDAVLLELFPSAQFHEENGYFKCRDNSGSLLGYAIISEGNGYGGKMKVVVGVGLDNVVVGARVLSHSETIGVGSRITENSFLNQFSGKTLDNLRLTRDGGAIDAITGATFSSNAFTNAARDGFQLIIQKVGGG